MPSVFRLPNRRTSATASLFLLVLTLAFLMAQHVTVSVEVSEAKPAVLFEHKLHAATPIRVMAPAKPARGQNGPGGSQPWVRWNYIP